jgi:hypothetical protein
MAIPVTLYLPATELEANVAAVHLAIDLWTGIKLRAERLSKI